jgi:hypothetical protein
VALTPAAFRAFIRKKYLAPSSRSVSVTEFGVAAPEFVTVTMDCEVELKSDAVE